MTVSIENLKIVTIEENKHNGVYAIEPLPTGFGYTIGNALRRVLLTSITGAAATQVKIAGVNHQFTTIPGVKEDLIELTLNIKKVRFKLQGNNPVVVTIKKKGPGVVTAGDIEELADIKVMNKDLHIATLADNKTEFNAEIVVECGVGYSPMEERQTSKIGVIVLDALFSPVLNASFDVEPTRFADRTDLDKITIKLETDGSVSPKEAVKKAAEILKDYYAVVQKWETEEEVSEFDGAEEVSDITSKSKSEDVGIEELPLQTRTINSLKKSGITSLSQLAKLSDEELSDIKNLGEKSVEEIKKLLSKEGLR
jgi:DNA-directed RNA polymerase subunit alpha